MTYDVLIDFLEVKGFKANKSIVLKHDGEKCVGLWLDASGILGLNRLIRLKEVLDEDKWSITLLSNIDEIHISRKHG